MSKLFNISGNFTQNGEWINPTLAFAGEIVVNETGKFYGWCEQFCAEGSDNDSVICQTDKIRCLAGALAEEDNGYSLLFFKLSNAPWQPPLLYEFHSASAANCIWSVKDPGGGFVPQGNAKVSLTEVPYTEADANRIKERFYESNVGINENDPLIQEIDSWQKKTLVLWV